MVQWIDKKRLGVGWTKGWWILSFLGSARDDVNDLCIRNGFAIHEDSLRMAADSQVQSQLTEAWLKFFLVELDISWPFLVLFSWDPGGNIGDPTVMKIQLAHQPTSFFLWSIELPSATSDQDEMRIKLELKQVLSEANEMGKMKEVLKQMLGLHSWNCFRIVQYPLVAETDNSYWRIDFGWFFPSCHSKDRQWSTSSCTFSSVWARMFVVPLYLGKVWGDHDGWYLWGGIFFVKQCSLVKKPRQMSEEFQWKVNLSFSCGKLKKWPFQRQRRPALFPQEEERVLSELRGALLEANESGKLPQLLKEILGSAGVVRVVINVWGVELFFHVVFPQTPSKEQTLPSSAGY